MTRARPSLVLLLVLASAPAAQFSVDLGGGRKLARSAEEIDEGTASVVIGFERFLNGQALEGDELGSWVTISASGSNAGLGIFDSTPGGPNDPGLDPDLLVGTGNLLILQSDGVPGQTVPGIFDQPNDDMDGGTIRFTFASAVQPASVDLVDICPGGGLAAVTLTDVAGAVRSFAVPAGFTTDVAAMGPPGYGTLNLQTLEPQVGAAGVATATATETPGFDGGSVIELEIFVEGSAGVDRLVLGEGSCALPQAVYTCREPLDVDGADVNGDGFLDLIVPDATDNVVRVFLNDGEGLFLPDVAYGVADSPQEVRVVDMNGDGDLDLVAACLFLTGAGSSNGAISVLLNNGDGTFGAQAEYVLPDTISSVATADFDGDGDLDVAIGPRFTGQAELYSLSNAGDGTLFGLVQIPSLLENHDNLMSGDLDLDGWPDLAISVSFPGQFLVWLNDGTGSFGAPVSYALGGSTEQAVLADLDDDGDDDVAVVRSSVVEILFNDGAGVFGGLTSYPLGASSGDSVTAADFDGDGDLDLAAGRAAGFSMLRNEGGGVFSSWAEYESIRLAARLAAADVENDGDLDLLIADDRAHVLLNDGTGTFHVRLDNPTSDGPSNLAIGDLDGDGVPEALVTAANADVLDVLTSNGDGTFGAPTSYAVTQRPEALVVHDLSGDGANDVALVGSITSEVAVLLNQGGGVLGGYAALPAGPFPRDVAAGDWDGDGDADLVVCCDQNLLNGGLVRFYDNTGGGVFAFDSSTPQDKPRQAVPGDYDLDGDLDLAVTLETPDLLRVFENDGTGFFGSSIDYRTANRPSSMVAADLDLDGTLDLAYAHIETGIVGDEIASVRLNNGDGSFGTNVDYAVGDGARGLAARDVDGDGATDLLSANFSAFTVTVLTSAGNGTFAGRSDYAAGANPQAVESFDLNGDGRMDVLCAENSSDSLSTLIQECD